MIRYYQESIINFCYEVALDLTQIGEGKGSYMIKGVWVCK